MKSKWWKLSLAVLLVLIGVVGTLAYTQHYKPVAKANPNIRPHIPPVEPNLNELAIIVNEYRVSKDLKPLVRDARLDASAKAKCDDMVAKNYWAHNAPDGTETWHFIYEKLGYKPHKVAENLANNDYGSIDVLNKWEKSPLHNKELTDPLFNIVGYATCKTLRSGSFTQYYIVVQHFAQM